MTARRLSVFTAAFALVVGITYAPSAARGADSAQYLALMQRLAEATLGAPQPGALAHVYVAGLPPEGAPPLPPDATIVGSVVREGTGLTVYADVPHARDASVAAIDALLVKAGYGRIPSYGQGGFTLGKQPPTATYCTAANSVVVRAYASASDASTTRVDIIVFSGKMRQFTCMDAAALQRLLADQRQAIPVLHGTDALTIVSATSQSSGNWGVAEGETFHATTGWGRVASALSVDALDAALTNQLVEGGWTSAGTTTLGSARVHRFTTPSGTDYGAGDATLTLVPATPGAYDAFVRVTQQPLAPKG